MEGKKERVGLLDGVEDGFDVGLELGRVDGLDVGLSDGCVEGFGDNVGFPVG